MGLANCTCSPAGVEEGSSSAPGVPGRPASATLGPGLPASGSKKLAGGAASSWLIAKGRAVRVRWTSAGDHLDLRPAVLLPDVVDVPAKVVQVAAGEAHALILAVTNAGAETRVFSVGVNGFGQLGLGDTMSRASQASQATPIPELGPSTRIMGVACGGHVSMAFSQRGQLYTWGKNEESGVLGVGSTPVACITVPMIVENLARKVRTLQALTTGWTAFCVSHLGGVFSWGGGLCGTHGHGHQEDEPTPKILRSLEGMPILQVAPGALHVLALTNRGEVLTWGRIAGAFGAEVQLQLLPKAVDALLGTKIVQVAAGAEHNLALAESGEVYGWGAHAAGALGDCGLKGSTQVFAMVHQLQIERLGRVRWLACGKCHSLFLADAEDSANTDDKGKAIDLWVAGSAAKVSEHAAVGWGGEKATRAGWGQELVRSVGYPLHATRVDQKLVLELMG